MKLQVLDTTGNKTKEIEMPSQFSEAYHPDLISRAVLSLRANARQPYGTLIGAGNRASAKLSRRRRDYKGAYGHGISRVPRKSLWKRGTQFGWVGALVSSTVGGRVAHPPRADRVWAQKINIKERRKAIRSALSATLNTILIAKRNHQLPKNFPFLIDSKIESISKTKELKNILITLGLKEELVRCKLRECVGPLIVISNPKSPLLKLKNIEGVEISLVSNLNAGLLAPGSHAGRLTLYTDSAIEELNKKGLFTK